MRSAVTVSLVPEASGGPFVFWEDLPSACRQAAQLGFDAIEIFPPDADAIPVDVVRPLLDRHDLKLAAVGTGGGWVRHRLSLTSPDPLVRAQAREFVRSLIDAAARLGAPVIVGSLQGRWGESISRDDAIGLLADALSDLGEQARRHDVGLFFEPLNRYETNLINTLADGAALLQTLSTCNVRLLGDLYHMNIEEADLAAAICSVPHVLGHVHLADSNRRPAGNGHTDFSAIAAALSCIGYGGYLSAECLPWPDPGAAAKTTIEAFRRYFNVGRQNEP